jgi:exodeoxyribonuclease V alpha subunit
MAQGRMAASQISAPTENLAGLVERVVFHNPESGFCVLRVTARGHREPITIVGHAPLISPGEFVQASGVWANDRTHGVQFRASFLKPTAPTTRGGIEKYLASGLLRGIGAVYAKKLVSAFGDAVLDVIENEPARLRQVPGIGPKRARQIAAGWAGQRAVREIMLFLTEHGVGTARAARIYKIYGAEAVRLISEDPYRLARDIRGIGFRSADQIALHLGIAKTAPIRVRAGISHALAEAQADGHCGLPEEDLAALAETLLEVPAELIETALALEIAAGAVIVDTVAGRRCVFLAALYNAERDIAARLKALAAGMPSWAAIDADRAIPWVEGCTGLVLADSQKAAIRVALGAKIVVITGGPGVGKTTLVNSVLKILIAKRARVLLCAPTGRAAKRLGDSTGIAAQTIHRLLEADPAGGGFRRDETEPLDCDLLVIDETSMVDVPLIRALLRAVPDSAALVLVGDVDQLPSVGPGQVLADIIASGAAPVVRLTEVFRQAAQSRIITNAHCINRGEMPDLAASDGGDFYFVDAADPEDAVNKLVRVVTERIPRRFGLDPVRDIQVLSPMNRGGLGARALNTALQQALNPPGDNHIERFGAVFGPGDKVMQVENDYDKDVFNGDQGIVAGLDIAAGELTVDFDGRRVLYSQGELDELALAYATTIHKSQGSEYPAVVIALATQHYPMLQRNLVYTGVTRGKRLVVLVGQRRALGIAVGGGGSAPGARRRWSKLREWLEADGATPNPSAGEGAP